VAQGDLVGVADQPGGHAQQPVTHAAKVGSASSVAVIEAGEFL
jgi:hypothetical protein